MIRRRWGRRAAELATLIVLLLPFVRRPAEAAPLRRESATGELDPAERLDPATLDAVAARGASRLDALRSRLGGSLARVHEALDARQRQVLAELVRSGPHRHRAHGRA